MGSFSFGQSKDSSRELKRLNAKIDRVRVMVDSLELDNQILLPELMSAFKESVKGKTQQDSITLMLLRKINTLDNRIRQIESGSGFTDSTNNEIMNRLLHVENKIVTLTKTYKEMSNLNSGSDNIVGQEIQKFDTELYAKSLGNFQKEYFQEAIVGFHKLVLMDNDHSLADNSQYWLAECYYAQKDYKKAIFEFEKVFTYAGTDKEDDAMLKIAYSYQSMGNVEKASENFKRLIDYKPGSEFYPLAKQRLKQLSVN
jgi:TolA-binding protein